MVVTNFVLRKGLMRYSRSTMRHHNGRFIKKKDAAAAAPAPKPAAEAKPSAAEAAAKKKALKERLRYWLPHRRFVTPAKRAAEKARHRAQVGLPALRASLVPGAVLILLGGRFVGKRVVLLKRLERSGMLLVTGPFRANGVPLRRVNPAYVIATSTRVEGVADIDGIAQVTDKLFVKPRAPKAKTDERTFFSRKMTAEERKKVQAAKKARINPERFALQKKIDTQLLERIAKVELLGDYLASRFTLKNGQYPHALKF